MNENQINKLILLARNGSAEAQNELGVHYATEGMSDGTANRVALKWYLEAACSGYAEALWNAGSMLVDGEDGVERSEGLGLLLIRLAADVFNSSACLYLSRCYEHGRHGILSNHELAKLWSRMAFSMERIQIYSDAAELSFLSSHPDVRRYIELDE